MPRRLALVLGACAVLVAGCSYGFEVLIPANSTIDDLAFEFGDFDGGRLSVVPSSIRVYRCESIHERSNGNFYPPPSEAVWSAHGPAPLKAYGCYDKIFSK